MADPISKKEFVRRVAVHMKADDKTAEEWINGITDTLYEVFKEGHGVSLQGFGGFYLDQRRNGCAFKFNPGQRLKALFGWASSYRGQL